MKNYNLNGYFITKVQLDRKRGEIEIQCSKMIYFQFVLVKVNLPIERNEVYGYSNNTWHFMATLSESNV